MLRSELAPARASAPVRTPVTLPPALALDHPFERAPTAVSTEALQRGPTPTDERGVTARPIAGA
jgi:hypothetical protein